MRKLRLFILLTLIMGLLPLGVSTTEVGQVQAARLNANCATDLIISEYIEGSSFNKALEIYNGTGATVDLTGYRLSLYSNGSTTAGSTYDFSGTLANDDVFVVAHSSADAPIQSVADDTSGVANFNGNDAVVLSKEGTDIDVLGEVGNDAYWGGDVTLVRKATVNAASTTFDSNDWDEYAQDTFSYLGSHTMTCAGELSLNKTAPAHVEVSETFTYTLTVSNTTGVALNNVVLTDTLPSGVTFVSASNGGVHSGGVVSWTVTSLADGNAFSPTFSVTAPATSTTVTNDDYAVHAANWITSTLGAPIDTDVVLPLTIYEVQYTTDPGGGTYPSPYEDEMAVLTGTVYALYPGRGFFIADAEGPWHGLYAYYPGGDLPAIGDEVQVVGTVKEYYGVTELSEGVTYSVLSSGNQPHGPSVVTTTEIPFNTPGTSEEYEDVFVEIHGATVTAAADNYGIWTFTDSSGGSAKGDDWGYDFEPNVGDELAIVRGALVYDFSEYKVIPRDADDVIPYSLDLTKTAPANVNSDELFTYTLSVENFTGIDLTNVVITDAIPANTTFAYALDGGVESGGIVSWTLPSLTHTSSISVQFAVTGTSGSAVVYNDNYAVSAQNHVTPTFGAQVLTVVGSGLSIHYIQGTGDVSPLNGQNVEDVYGIVTAVHVDGFYMQEPNPDADEETSEGIYVYVGSAPGVSVGEGVQVDGLVSEYFGMTQISSSAITDMPNGVVISPTTVTLPVTQRSDLEKYESMLVTLPQELTVTEVYQLGRYGEIALSQGGRLFNPTNVITPGTPAQNLQAANDLRRLVLDDGSSASYPDPIPYPDPELSATNTLRIGYVLTDATGILSYGHDAYRLHPTLTPNFTPGNQRTAAPEEVGGSLRVASFNVLNYFNGDGQGGDFPTSRGADSLVEFERQHDKIVEAILALDADVIGLMEIENDGYGQYSAIQDLVDGLNNVAGAGTYAFIDPGVSQIGTDEIAVGLIYNTNTVYPAGDAAILDSSTAVPGTTFDDTKNRPALAQSFAEEGTDALFTVVVNHLKSKGSACGAGDDVPDYEGGNCNLTRTEAAEALAAWIATDPTGSGDPDALIIGDLNAYAMEDPITTLEDAGYTDLLETYVGPDAYSYVFDGQAGYLDHALANPAIATQVTSATVWHINTDEPLAIDYNNDESNDEPYHYAPNAYRASDHDPVLLGLNLEYNVTFVYHDLENVVPSGVTLHVAGDFNGWSTTATPMTTDGNGIYTATITTSEASLASDYKYIAGDNWNNNRGDILNTSNRHFDVSGATVLNDYRNVTAGYVALNGPATATVDFGDPTPVINGEAWYSDIPFGENQALSAQMGYGTDPDPANWTWVEASFAGRNGNNDVFTATLQPASAGTYSYTIRVDGNWGTTNPNSMWDYGDLDGVYPGEPFELSQVGVLTVRGGPDLTTSVKVSSHADARVMPGALVTYTVSLTNTGESPATVILTDTLGSYYTVHDLGDFTETVASTLTWTGSIPGGGMEELWFTVQVADLGDLETGRTLLENSILMDDGVNPPSPIADAHPPYVDITAIYLPLITRNAP